MTIDKCPMSDDSLPLLPLVLGQVPAGLRRALAQAGVPCCDQATMPSAGRFVLFDSSGGRRPPVVQGQVPIDVDRLRSPRGADPLAASEDTDPSSFILH